tara:strand:- start:474 stop:671 length:198 start_codon:yes stop_codon:yes gene_type:complete
MMSKDDYYDAMGLSVYIAKSRAGLSSSVAKLLIKRGLVTVNGEVITITTHPVRLTDEIKIKGRTV